jgi:hypothetical protein
MDFISQSRVKLYAKNLLMQANFSFYSSLTAYIKDPFKFPMTLVYLSHFNTLIFIPIIIS